MQRWRFEKPLSRVAKCISPTKWVGEHDRRKSWNLHSQGATSKRQIYKLVQHGELACILLRRTHWYHLQAREKMKENSKVRTSVTDKLVTFFERVQAF